VIQSFNHFSQKIEALIVLLNETESDRRSSRLASTVSLIWSPFGADFVSIIEFV